jgi:hypothetical protein
MTGVIFGQLAVTDADLQGCATCNRSAVLESYRQACHAPEQVEQTPTEEGEQCHPHAKREAAHTDEDR